MSLLVPSMHGIIGGPGGVSLPNIGNRVFWWDAAGQGGGTYLDEAATIPATDNTRVAAVKGAEGRIFRQNIATDRPLYRLNRQNGLPGLYFEAARGDYLYTNQAFITAMQALTQLTVLIVWAPPNSTRSALRFTRVTNRGLRLGTGGNGVIHAWRKGNNSVGDELEINDPANINVAGAALFTYGGFGQAMRLDDHRANSATGTGDSAEGSVWDRGVIGTGVDSEGVFGEYWNGWIYEIVIWDAAADGSQRTAALAYATTKWGLT